MNLPLVARILERRLTANALPQPHRRLLAAGAHAYLAKPIDVREFLEVIDNVLLLPARQS